MQNILRMPFERLAAFTLFALFVLFLIADPAQAASHTDDFASLWDMLEAWTTGSLGKSVALAFLLTGLFAGIARGNLFAAVCCIGCALALVLAPDLITAIFGDGMGG